MTPRTVSAAKYAKMSQPERYAYLTAGGLHPDSAARMTQEGLTLDGKPVASKPKTAKQKAAQYKPPGARPEDVYAGLKREGLDDQTIRDLSQHVDFSKILKEAGTSRDAVTKILLAGQHVIDSAQTQTLLGVQELQIKREAFDITEAEYVAGLLKLGFDENEPHLQEVMSGMVESEKEELRGLVAFEASMRNLAAVDEEIAQSQAARLRAEQEQEAKLLAVDEVFGKFQKHAGDPSVMEEVAPLIQALYEGDIPEASAVEKAVQDGLVKSTAIRLQMEDHVRDVELHDALVKSGAYGLDAQVGENGEVQRPSMRPVEEFLDAARLEVIPEGKPTVMEVFEKQLAPEERAREEAEAIQVIAAKATEAAENDTGTENKSPEMLNWENRQATADPTGPVVVDSPPKEF